MKYRSLPARLAAGLLLSALALTLTACGNIIYHEPEYNYAGRPIPPSGLLERVMAGYTVNGSTGGLAILDGLRNIRSNVQNTIPNFSIKGFSAAQPTYIISYPSELTGYVFSQTDGNLFSVNYGTETGGGAVAGFGANAPSVAASPDGTRFAGAAEAAGTLGLNGVSGPIALNLPNVDKVVINRGSTVILAMVRNSNSLYRVVKLPATSTPVIPPGSVDCEPLLLPSYCVVPVGNTNSAGVAGAAYDRPVDAYFSLDGNSVYILNCGPECGGTRAGVTVLQTAALEFMNVPTVSPLAPAAPSPLQTIGAANPVAVPGGVTVAQADGTTLYLAGQQLQPSGLFAGNLTTLNLSAAGVTPYTVTGTYSIADGTHTRMLFADDNTLWIGSSQCANGPRAAAAAAGSAAQSANYNCLSRFVPNAPLLGANPPPGTPVPASTIVPLWTPNAAYVPGQLTCDVPVTLAGGTFCNGGNLQVVVAGGTSGGSTPKWSTALDSPTSDGSVLWANLGPLAPVQIIPALTPNNAYVPPTGQPGTTLNVQYQNANLNPVYYGSLTGECWVQNYHKIYTAYGGQIHAFNTVDGSEINNYYVTIQGTVFDVAYIDAESDSAN